MKKLILAGLLLLGSVIAANATTVVSLIGDKDGFGKGITSGSSFNIEDITDVGFSNGTENGTDIWLYGPKSITHSYSLATLGTITSAQLEIFTGGQGWTGLTTLSMDGRLIGTLTDGDLSVPGIYVPNANIAWLDTFNLMPYLTLINGSEILTVETILPGDAWVLDYSQLTLSDTVAPVPEPSTMLLLGGGLAGLAFWRRKSAKK